MNEHDSNEEEATSRLLLRAGPARADAVAAVLAALQPAGLLVRDGWDRGLLHVAREHGVALLVDDEVDPDADGVHLKEPGRVGEVRVELDRNEKNRLILGADVGLSRHDAIIAGEDGADYVAFGKRGQSADDAVIELVTWWREVTIMPCLAYAEDVDAVRRLARLGTEFIGVSSAIWDHVDGPAPAARELAAALEKS